MAEPTDPFDGTPESLDGGPFDDLDVEPFDLDPGEEISTEELIANGAPAVKATRPPGWLALLLLGIVTVICVVAISATLVLPVIFVGLEETPDDAIQPLTTLATLGVGALAALLGGESKR